MCPWSSKRAPNEMNKTIHLDLRTGSAWTLTLIYPAISTLKNPSPHTSTSDHVPPSGDAWHWQSVPLPRPSTKASIGGVLVCHVEDGPTLGGSLGRRNLKELDGLPCLGRIAVGIGFMGSLCCRCCCLLMPIYKPIVDKHGKSVCFPFFPLVFLSRGLAAWFPRNRVFCQGTLWMWI